MGRQYSNSLRASFLLLSSASLMAGCGDPEIIVPDVMSIVAMVPSGGTVNVSRDVQPVVYFSHPAADAAEVEAALHLNCLGTPPCSAPTASGCTATEVAAQTSYDAGNQLAKLIPDEQLLSDTCYAFIIDQDIAAEDENVAPLPVQIRVSFQTE